MLYQYNHKDFEKCVGLFVAAFTAPPLRYTWLTREKARRYLRDITRTPGFIGYVYESEGQNGRTGDIAAFCFGVVDDYFHTPQYEIKELAVLPDLHGQGIGSAAMLALEAKLAENGIAAVCLQTSRAIPAFYFYRKLGYEEAAENVSLMKLLP